MIGLPDESESRVSSVKKNFIQRKKALIVSGVVVALVLVLFGTNAWGNLKIIAQPTRNSTICPIHEFKSAQVFLDDNSTIETILRDEKFRLQSVKKLSGAVQVDTQVTDQLPDVDEAPEVWAKFKSFHRYLEKTFPTVYENLEVDYVNTYGLVFYWKGSDPKLKPVMFCAHQDVVPVQKDTLEDWTYPPFEGHYDGKHIYGRGASDCKNVLIAIMESIEILLAKGFKPERGVIAAFGFDEEISGHRGAANIAKHLEKKLGHNSIHSLLDEGQGLTKDPMTGQILAAPAVGEKGYVDIYVELTTPGGHSSVPPDHTSIGIMSELAQLIELDPYNPVLSSSNPTLHYLQCLAANSDKLPKLSKKAILRAGFDKLANKKVVSMLVKNRITSALIRTTQALDLFVGGEKANALPENVKLVVNHRVAVENSLQEVQTHFAERVLKVAKNHGLALTSYGEKIYEGDGKSGHFEITSFSNLKAAPLSPTNDTVWEFMAGTTRHIFENFVFPDLKYPIILAPFMMPANTDTRYYWNLTKNIYRYTPAFVQDMIKDNRIHSVDERLEFDAHLQLISFFYEYIQVINTAKADNKDSK